VAIDGKYGRVTFEKDNTIGENEPVVVFRAQDKLLPEVLNAYQRLAIKAGSPERHLQAIEAAKSDVEHWQALNDTQVPQSATWTPEGR
jgi:hypothetical protein